MKIYDKIIIPNFSRENEYILVLVEVLDYGTKLGRVIAINSETFVRLTEMVLVKNFQNITDAEMKKITASKEWKKA